MLKIDKEDFVEELKAELYGYEEITEEHIELFMNKLNDFFKNKKGKKDRISYKANSTIINLKDESEIFNMVDTYLAAVVNDEVGAYLEAFDL